MRSSPWFSKKIALEEKSGNTSYSMDPGHLLNWRGLQSVFGRELVVDEQHELRCLTQKQQQICYVGLAGQDSATVRCLSQVQISSDCRTMVLQPTILLFLGFHVFWLRIALDKTIALVNVPSGCCQLGMGINPYY